jgi:hypothetical protein
MERSQIQFKRTIYKIYFKPAVYVVISRSLLHSLHHVRVSSIILGIAVIRFQLFVPTDCWLMAYENGDYRTTCKHELYKSPSETLWMLEEVYSKIAMKKNKCLQVT